MSSAFRLRPFARRALVVRASGLFALSGLLFAVLLFIGQDRFVVPCLREAQAEEPPGQELEPLPRLIAFPSDDSERFNAGIREKIQAQIGRTFASLGDVALGREVLVLRYGVLSAPALIGVLQRSSNETETWNAALTIGALRDVEGGSYELKPAVAPLVKLAADRAKSPHTRALACIALGCYPWAEGVMPARYAEMAGWYTPVPGPARESAKVVKALADARRTLVRRASDKLAFTSVSALLALAKMGGDAAGEELFAGPPQEYANTRPERALLLARAFLGRGGVQDFVGLAGLASPESRVRSTAALAMAVALLKEKPAAWTHEGASLLKQLKATDPTLPNEEEAVFARGVCAYVNQVDEEWRALWGCAITSSTKRNCATAAAQMLLFLDLPWFRDAVVDWAKKPGSAMKEPVLALVLLRAGSLGTQEAFAAVSEWLQSGALRPSSDDAWDPRWYAVVGILRALHDGRMPSQEQRTAAVTLLRSALTRRIIHKDAAIRPALERVLEEHAERLTAPSGAAAYRLPLAAVRAVEGSFVCPHGLLAVDPIDACVRRVNDATWELWGLSALSPNKPGEVRQQPERYLKRYLEKYPYFSRLEFLHARGYRDLPAYEETSELVLDR